MVLHFPADDVHYRGWAPYSEQHSQLDHADYTYTLEEPNSAGVVNPVLVTAVSL